MHSMPLKVYVAGKVSKDSVFGKHDWRDEFCQELSRLCGSPIINVDPTKAELGFDLDENNAELIFGRDCYMIQQADLVIVNLTNDISVGGSQEMLIAKYFDKPLVGIAPFGGKFYMAKKEMMGKEYTNWMHAFVKYPCDKVVEDIQGVADYIKSGLGPAKSIKIIDESIEYYLKHHHEHDDYLRGY